VKIKEKNAHVIDKISSGRYNKKEGSKGVSYEIIRRIHRFYGGFEKNVSRRKGHLVCAVDFYDGKGRRNYAWGRQF
jgi:hypothetical protein